VSQTFRWPVSGTLDTPANSPLYQEVTLPGGTTALKQWVDKLNPADSYFITHLRLQRLPGAELLPPSSVTTGSSGIRYRVPARGQLILCQIEPNEGSTHESIDNQLPPCANAGNLARTLPATADAIWEGMAAQLGRVQYLPYKNGHFRTIPFRQPSIRTARCRARSTVSPVAAAWPPRTRSTLSRQRRDKRPSPLLRHRPRRSTLSSHRFRHRTIWSALKRRRQQQRILPCQCERCAAQRFGLSS